MNLHSNFLPLCFPSRLSKHAWGKKSPFHAKVQQLVSKAWRPRENFHRFNRGGEVLRAFERSRFFVWAVKKDVSFWGKNETILSIWRLLWKKLLEGFFERNLIWSANSLVWIEILQVEGLLKGVWWWIYVLENSKFLRSGWLRSESSIKGYEVQVYSKSWQTTITTKPECFGDFGVNSLTKKTTRLREFPTGGLELVVIVCL